MLSRIALSHFITSSMLILRSGCLNLAIYSSSHLSHSNVVVCGVFVKNFERCKFDCWRPQQFTCIFENKDFWVASSCIALATILTAIFGMVAFFVLSQKEKVVLSEAKFDETRIALTSSQLLMFIFYVLCSSSSIDNQDQDQNTMF